MLTRSQTANAIPISISLHLPWYVNIFLSFSEVYFACVPRRGIILRIFNPISGF